MKFNVFLKQLRLKAGFTQQNIASLLEMDRSTYAYYELGKTEPNIQNLLKIAAVYNMSMDDLLRSNPDTPALTLASSTPAPAADAEDFRTLSREEQKLVFLYRCAADKEAFLNHIRAFEDADDADATTSE